MHSFTVFNPCREYTHESNLWSETSVFWWLLIQELAVKFEATSAKVDKGPTPDGNVLFACGRYYSFFFFTSVTKRFGVYSVTSGILDGFLESCTSFPLGTAYLFVIKTVFHALPSHYLLNDSKKTRENYSRSKADAAQVRGWHSNPCPHTPATE